MIKVKDIWGLTQLSEVAKGEQGSRGARENASVPVSVQLSATERHEKA